jgi:hypothetical protein
MLNVIVCFDWDALNGPEPFINIWWGDLASVRVEGYTNLVSRYNS